MSIFTDLVDAAQAAAEYLTLGTLDHGTCRCPACINRDRLIEALRVVDETLDEGTSPVAAGVNCNCDADNVHIPVCPRHGRKRV